jgi:hypothetical protein
MTRIEKPAIEYVRVSTKQQGNRVAAFTAHGSNGPKPDKYDPTQSARCGSRRHIFLMPKADVEVHGVARHA